MSRRDQRPLFGKKLPPRPKLAEGKAPGERDTKAERIRTAIAAEDWREALRLAMKLYSLGEDEPAISRAWEAMVRPDFLRALRRDPETAVEAGKAALRRRFGG